MAPEIAASKPDLGAKAKKKGILENDQHQNCDNLLTITIATLIQPLQYDLRCPPAKDHARSRSTKAP